jgi:predicted DNA-binding protein
MADAKLIFRLPEELKNAFENACKRQDRTASQILRDMIRAYVRENQPDLGFDEKPAKRGKK